MPKENNAIKKINPLVASYDRGIKIWVHSITMEKLGLNLGKNVNMRNQLDLRLF